MLLSIHQSLPLLSIHTCCIDFSKHISTHQSPLHLFQLTLNSCNLLSTHQSLHLLFAHQSLPLIYGPMILFSSPTSLYCIDFSRCIPPILVEFISTNTKILQLFYPLSNLHLPSIGFDHLLYTHQNSLHSFR